jgi:hypothetical protein
LSLRFGVPQESGSAGASWHRSDGEIHVVYSNEGGATVFLAR